MPDSCNLLRISSAEVRKKIFAEGNEELVLGYLPGIAVQRFPVRVLACVHGTRA